MVAALPVFRDSITSVAADLNALAANVTNLYAVAMGGASRTSSKPHLVLRAYTASQSVATSTDTLLAWDVADVNTDSMWSSGNQITINTSGTYRMSLTAGTTGAFGDQVTAYVLVNGTSSAANGVGVWHDTHCRYGRAAATVQLAAGAHVYGMMRQLSGVTRTVGNLSRMELSYLGPI